jgi:peptidyl-prolyl cis-trans isomerase B (cyclophilin B)
MEEMENKIAVMETSHGTITLEFFPGDAPNHVSNFIKLSRKGFYDGLIFHRVIKGFMFQSGCPDGDGRGGPGYQLKAEFNSRKHMPGTLSMARSGDPDSAGSQFYICLARIPHLDGEYTVFGQVTDGMNVVERIGKVETDTGDRPVEPVFINRIIINDKQDSETDK